MNEELRTPGQTSGAEGPTGPPPGVPSPSEPPRRRFDWSQPEFAWPLSLAGGFGGALVGLSTGLPGLAAVIAAAVFAPILVRLQVMRRPGTAYLCALAWLVGIVGAMTGFAVENGAEAARAAIPFAGTWIDQEWGFLGGHDEPAFPLRLGRNAALFLLTALMARPWGGILALLPTALVASLLGAGTGSFALRAAEKDWSPTLAVVGGSPPHVVLALGACLAVVVVIAHPGPLLPLARLSRLHRRLAAWGVGVGLGSLLLEPVLDRIWTSWLPTFLPPAG